MSERALPCAESEHLMMVSSASLRLGAAGMRSSDVLVGTLRNGVKVTTAQLEAAARLLEDAEPSIITGVSGAARGVTVGVEQERPGFIHAERQVDPKVLTFDVGVLGSTYHIDRDGMVCDVPA